MIEILFRFGGEVVLVRIDGSNVSFGNNSYGAQLATIDGISLSKEGCIKEFPELDGDPEWEKKTIEKFKEHIRNLKTEKDRAQYLIKDLRKHGYLPWRIRESGRRSRLIK